MHVPCTGDVHSRRDVWGFRKTDRYVSFGLRYKIKGLSHSRHGGGKKEEDSWGHDLSSDVIFNALDQFIGDFFLFFFLSLFLFLEGSEG